MKDAGHFPEITTDDEEESAERRRFEEIEEQKIYWSR